MSFILLCLPGSKIPKYSFLALIHADKWVHIGLFGVLCLLFSFPFRSSGYPSRERQKWFMRIALAAVLYGVLMEFVQKYWIPGRSFEIADILADTTGCVLGWLYSVKAFGGLKKIGPDRNRDRNQN